MRLGVLIAAFVALAIVGLADQHHTRRISAHASADFWWCTHVRVRCTGFDERTHHARWEQRELGYEAGGAVLAGAILVVVAGKRLRLRL
jgi:hypothetical protein